MRQLLSRGVLLTLAVLGAAVVVPLAVAGGAPSIAFGSSPSGAFGTVAKNSTTTNTYTVTNSGGSATGALKVSLTGASDFSVASDTCTAASVGPKKSCKIGITYAPTTDGANDAGALTVSSKKPQASATVNLTGSTAAAGPYAASRADCSALGGTFSTDPSTNFQSVFSTGSTFLWTCNDGPSPGFANSLFAACITDSGGVAEMDFSSVAPWDSTCYRVH